MAVKLKFKFQLSKHASLHEAGASVWVDTDRDGNIDEEDKIELKSDAAHPLTFLAECDLKVTSTTDVGFVLKFVGDPNAKWSLVVTSGDEGGDAVYEMKDRPVGTPFRQIMGWCS